MAYTFSAYEIQVISLNILPAVHLCNGYGTEGTMSLLSTAITLTDDNEIKVNQPFYWNMQRRTINRVTTQSVEGDFRSNDRANAIQLIPYVPVKYQDIT